MGKNSNIFLRFLIANLKNSNPYSFTQILNCVVLWVNDGDRPAGGRFLVLLL